FIFFFFFQAEDGIRDFHVTGVQTCALPIWRSMIKNKTHAIINILGLTIGLSAFFLVFTVVIDELSYDKFWTNNANIYKVYWNDHSALHQKRPYSPEELGYALQQQFPEMEYFSPISTDDEYFHIDTKNTDRKS